jgi:hypothetical protein
MFAYRKQRSLDKTSIQMRELLKTIPFSEILQTLALIVLVVGGYAIITFISNL